MRDEPLNEYLFDILRHSRATDCFQIFGKILP
jgi:hypothetical protein